MDSDVDADIPVRIKPTKKPQSNEIKSPLFSPFSPGNIRSQNTISPSSNYSLKSSKEKIDITEIRRILMKLKSEIDQEKKRNHELIEQNMKELNLQKHSLEVKHNKAIGQLNLSWKTKFDDLTKINNNHISELSKLKQKITDLSRSPSKPDLEIPDMDHVVAKINEFCNLESNNFSNTEELVKIINDLNHLVKGRMPNQPIDQDSNEMKIAKLKNQNTELTNIVKILDRKLKTSQYEYINLKKKLEEKELSLMNELVTERPDESKFDFETMLKRANSERLLLEKQLTWLHNRGEEDPATREKVETLTIFVKSFQKNQKLLEDQLSVLRDKSNKTENYINEISVLKIENEKLSKKVLDNSTIQKNYEKLKIEIESNQIRDQENLIKIKSLEILSEEYKTKLLAMDRLLKYIREISDKRTELEMEYAAMKALLETKLRNDFTKRETNTSSRDDHSEDSTEALKAELRELEKRCTQQALNYEEALLELEALKKTNQRSYFDFHRNGSKDDLAWLLQLMTNYSKEKNIHNSGSSSVTDEFNGFHRDEFSKLTDPFGLKTILQNKTDEKNDIKRETAIFGRSDTVSSTTENENKILPSLQTSNSACNKDYGETPNNELGFNTNLESQRKHIPAPTQIKIENHLNQKSTRVVRWKVPQIDVNIDKCNITAFHIYVDGHFYKAVSINETLAAVLPNLDLKRPHRIAVRSVCSQGQSKDAQCTIEIGSFSLAPSHLKANKITGNSAQISWIPSNSNWRHTVWVNGSKYCDCIPGIYKIVMQGLQPDNLQKVQVHPVIDKFVDNSPNSNNCAFLDFQTLPIYNSSSEGIQKPTDEIDYPTDVKLKLGNRPGKFVVKWVCPQLVTSPNIKIVGYSILINNQCIALVNGAKNDRFSIGLLDLRTINPPVSQNLLSQHDQSYLPLTVRTMATVTQSNFDSAVTECTIYSKDSQPILRFSGHVAARIAGTAAEAAIMLGDQLASFLNLMEANSDEKSGNLISKKKMHSSDHDKFNDSKGCWHSCYCLNNSEFYDNESSFLPRSKLDWMENNPYQYRSMSIHYLDQPRLNNQHRSLSDDSALDRLSDSREIRQNLSNELIDDVCSTESSSNSHNYVYQNPDLDSNSMRQKSISDHSSRRDEETNKYLAVRRISKQTQSPKISKEYPQAKISVPKIQITKDSSFSEDDDNPSIMSYRNKGRSMGDQYGKISQQQKPVSREQGEHKSRSNSTIDESVGIKNKNYPISPNDRINNQNQWNQNYNQDRINNINNERYNNYSHQKSAENIRYFVALFDYDPATMSPNSGAIHEELPFKSGQNIKVFGQVDEDGFYTGETNGRRGLVPSNMVSEIDVKSTFKPIDNSEITFQERIIGSIDRNKDSTISRSLQGKLNIDQYPIVSQSDYQNNPNQYSYNDYPMIHRKSTDSAVSYAASDPNSYQRSQVDTYMPRQPSAGNSRNPTEYRKMLALYDYDPQTLSPNVDSDAELAFKCNDIIEIIGEIDEDGFYMGRKNGQRGLVPSNFLTDLPPPLETRVRTQPSYQGSFDNMHNPNQYKERNFQAVSNFPEPPPNRDNRVRTKPFEIERSLIRNTSANNDEYLNERVSLPDAQKNNPSFEESFDSGPSVSRPYMVKSEPKPNPYHNTAPRMSIHEQNIDNKGMMYSNSGSPSSKMPNRSNKPITDRRSSHDKPIHRNQQPQNVPMRDLSPPPPFEADDMPIVMDLAPSKETQKKKKVSTNSENYRSNAFENQENYGNNESLYVNTNSVMSDNLERKRSVFKNPFKKKKS